MSEIDIWNNITTGMFFSSGSLIYNPYKDRFVDIAQMLPGKPTGLWDTVRLANRKYSYKNDDVSFLYTDDYTLRPCLKQCAKNYLGKYELNFLVDAFNRAYTEMKKHCEPNYFTSTLVLTPPDSRVAMHIHSRQYNPTFTYIISSGHNDSIGSVRLANEGTDYKNGAYDISIPYPNSKEFYTVFDSGLMHGTYTPAHDKNTYMFFVFDGVVITDKNTEHNKCYPI